MLPRLYGNIPYENLLNEALAKFVR